MDHLFGAILPAAIRKKGLSLGAAEMKAVAFDNLFLYEWLVLAHSLGLCVQQRTQIHGMDSHTK